METALEWVIIISLALAGIVWGAFKAFGKGTAEKFAEEVVAEIRRDARLSRELEVVRGSQRQEFRIKSYAKLWAKMDPLAVYADNEVDCDSMGSLSDDLSEWYFGGEGGLMLTTVARDFYFALQDLLRAVSKIPGWVAERSDEDLREHLCKHLDATSQQPDAGPRQAAVEELNELKSIDTRDWPPDDMEERAKAWRTAVQCIPHPHEAWLAIEPKVQFAILQQVSSVLRTVLAADLESRLR